MVFDLIKTAKELFFDNKKSKMAATNTQDAIDELHSKAITTENIKKQTVAIAGTLDGFTDFKNSTPIQAGESTNDRGFFLGFNGGAAVVYCVPRDDMRVGYATSAKNATNADTLDGIHASGFVKDDDNWAYLQENITVAAARAAAALPRSGGQMTGNIDLNNNLITNIRILRAISQNPLYLQSDNSVQVTNITGTANMDVRCAYLHCVSVVNDSFRGAKENIKPIQTNEAKKILDVPIYKYDYRPGFGGDRKNVIGTIADEAAKIIPESVVIPEDWNENEFNELLGDMENQNIPCVDYTVYIPYLIGMVQLQQKQIEELEKKIKGE